MRKMYKIIECKDGFTMSVQAFDGGYCLPRIDGAERYSAVEIGYPSAKESLIMEYAENPTAPTETVYAYVPSDTVTLVIAKHGGIISGEVPPGVIPLKAGK
mgnify:CR=1 FL=1